MSEGVLDVSVSEVPEVLLQVVGMCASAEETHVLTTYREPPSLALRTGCAPTSITASAALGRETRR